MKNKTQISSSFFVREFNKIFFDKNLKLFEKSKFLKLFKNFTNQPLALFFLIMSVILLLYKTLFAGSFVDNYRFWFIFLLLALVFCDKKAIKSYKSVIFLLGFILFGIISAVFSASGGVSLVILMNGIFLSSIFPLYFIIGSTFSKKDYKLLAIALLVICMPLMAAGLWQSLSGATTPEYWVSPVESLIKLRIYGWSENPNNLGAIAMLSGLLAVLVFWVKKRWYYLLYVIVALITTLLTFSRASWIGWLVAIGVLLLLKNWRYIWLLSLSLIGLIHPGLRQRVFSTFDPMFLRDSTLDGRIWSIGGIIEIFKNSPIFGMGPGTYGNSIARDYISPAYSVLPQNGFVASYMIDMQWPQILCQYGFFGIIFVAGFFISYFVNMLKEYLKTKSDICLFGLAILSVMLVVGFLENVWFFAPIACLYGVFLGGAIGYVRNK